MRSVVNLSRSQVYHSERPPYLFAARSPWCRASRGFVSDSRSLLTVNVHCSPTVFPANHFASSIVYVCVYGCWTTRGYANSRTGHLAEWPTRGLDNLRTGQVADCTTCGCHRRLCVLSFRCFWPFARTRVVQSASWQSASWRIRELSSYRVHRISSTCLKVK